MRSSGASRVIWRALVVAVVAAQVLSVGILVRDAVPELWESRWIQDDAYISFRYARNLVEGNGLVFNAGERVEGYTNFRWTVMSAAPLAAGYDDPLPAMHRAALALWFAAYGPLLVFGLYLVSRGVYTAPLMKALEVGAKGVTAAAPKSGGVAAVLGHKLFDDGEPGDEAYTSEPKRGDLLELYRARADELQRAMQPGAIREAVRKRVRASDPAVVDAIVAAEERKLKLLYDELPKPSGPPGLLDSQRAYVPSMAGLSRFARVVSAVDDPAAVIEQAAAGAPVAPEAARAVRTVYPRLIGEAQRRLIERSVDLEQPMGHYVNLFRNCVITR